MQQPSGRDDSFSSPSSDFSFPANGAESEHANNQRQKVFSGGFGMMATRPNNVFLGGSRTDRVIQPGLGTAQLCGMGQRESREDFRGQVRKVQILNFRSRRADHGPGGKASDVRLLLNCPNCSSEWMNPIS